MTLRTLSAFVTVVAVGFTACAFAAETAANPPARTDKAEQPAKPKPKTEVKCALTGRLGSKPVKNRQGKEVQILRLAVTEAKTADGKPLDDLKGKKVTVVPKKGLALDASVGKDVTVSGTLTNNKRMHPDSIK